ncbi:3'(2'),5'-bisphosphate nucleotidase [Cladophialophora psammophila CBS 110553]|uniref:3'(2'),5'-bisphosphate nucleotidase n=1 Tax=Cladophialophora psammophila CBS 110553 TaxID=1182543 RepID=W9VUW0_9EURO|nr:3'(2'),5'-bisphosphate nucleotidase [Cladophialophora psammophila CBS 110553]EXJ59333.1 3'(2'),5'-bisphosphate nucleotidase [Cladophialophora psammophila CBS 110553]
MSSQYAHEHQIALLAVQRATVLTQEVYNSTFKGTVSKSDASPVTIADFGAQALITSAILHNFPQDTIVAEEEASKLREHESLRNQLWHCVQNVRLDDEIAEETLGGPVATIEILLDAIDRGKGQGGNTGRVWAIDPVDGTKGLLRGGQYAIALALIVDGDVQVGVLGCPNLPVDDSVRLDAKIGFNQSGGVGSGVLISAEKGQGASSRRLTKGRLAPAHQVGMRPVRYVSNAILCEAVEPTFSNHAQQNAVARALEITKVVRLDSQAKYASLARGAADILLRLPVRKDYEENIWDHAAGDLIVREAGGIITDVFGKPLNFGVGRKLKENSGFVCAPQGIHAKVLAAVQDVLAIRP